MGGVAIFAAWLIAVSPALLHERAYWFYLAAVAGMCLLGLVDDHRSLTPQSKLLVQIVAAAILIAGGFSVHFFHSLPLDLVFSFFWIIGITNAFNLLDHMDGVSSGVAAVGGITLAAMYGSQGFLVESAVAAALTGASLGFLVFNRSPATIFMGDSGSLFLGMALAALAISPTATAVRGLVGAIFVPVLVLFVPILDTSLVVLTRLSSGRSIVQGGLDHTTHRLVVMGLSERAAAATLWTFAAVGGVGALLISYFAPTWSLLIVGIFLFALLLLALHLARLQVYEPTSTPSKVSVLVSNLLHKKRAAEVLFDLTASAISFFGAALLIGVSWSSLFVEWSTATIVVILIVAQTSTFGFLGLYRGKWRDFALSDVPRYLLAIALAAVIVTLVLLAAVPSPEIAFRLAVLDFVFTANLVLASRASERLLLSWGSRRGTNGHRALIYGAGARGEMLIRLLERGKPFRCEVVGFIDDVAASRSFRLFHARPVLGTGEMIPDLIQTHMITDVLIACDLEYGQMAQLVQQCDERGVQLRRFGWECGLVAPPEILSQPVSVIAVGR